MIQAVNKAIMERQKSNFRSDSVTIKLVAFDKKGHHKVLPSFIEQLTSEGSCIESFSSFGWEFVCSPRMNRFQYLFEAISLKLLAKQKSVHIAFLEAVHAERPAQHCVHCD